MMKKLIFTTFMTILTIISVYGQSMKVKDNGFKLLERDLTANTVGTKRISKQDGNVAALIKVVTTATDFNFDGGSYALVGDPEYHKGEIWIYVPARAQKITISHSKFGMMRDYYYPVPIEAGRTYEMLLDLGVGKYVTINTQTPGSLVFLDGDSLGVAPIYNTYVLYGKHKLSASNDKMEGTMDLNVVNDGHDNTEVYTIPMADQSRYFGKVNITTDRDAEIVLNGLVKGVGAWSGELREGDYVVETRKVNCDNEKTSFHVRAQSTNPVSAKSPTPHKGYLHLFTRPNYLNISHHGSPIQKTEKIELPVGIQTLTFSQKGYHNMEVEYDIKHNETLSDTINLKRIQYLKKNGFYFGGSYVVGPFSGLAGHLGVTFFNIDAQLSYMFGMSKSNQVNFYNPNDGSFLCRNEYALNAFSAKIGYQFALATHFGIVPQVGLSSQTLKCNVIEGTQSKGDGAACTAMTLGAKFIYSPVQHFCLFAAPEYDFAMSKDKMFDVVANAADFSAGGFFCHLGILANF